MPSQRPLPFASQNGSGGSHCAFFGSPSANGSWSAKRPWSGNAAHAVAKAGANFALAPSPAADGHVGGVVTCRPAPAMKLAADAPGATASIAARQPSSGAVRRPPTAPQTSARRDAKRHTPAPLTWEGLGDEE